MHKYLFIFLIALSIIFADQLSKWWIMYYIDLPSIRRIEVLSFFNLTMVWNHGVSFGLFAGDGDYHRWILVFVAVVICGIIINFARTEDRRLLLVAFACIIGGAIGNVIDRIIYGAVVDFLDFHLYGYYYPAFNIADMMIFCGVFAWLIFGGKKKEKRE